MMLALFLVTIIAIIGSADSFLAGHGSRALAGARSININSRQQHHFMTSPESSSNGVEAVVTIREAMVEEEETVEDVVLKIPENESPEDKYKREKLAEIAEKKSKEVFVTQTTGKYECQACGYTYDVAKGYAKKGIAPGTPFDEIESFRCPECGANKKYFVAGTETISGFKDNLKYGFGTNSMTGGQKGNLIFGGLALGFVLFMSGYLLE